MRRKTLREIQLGGEKAISTDYPLILTNRKGPVGILIPVTEESLISIQAHAERWMAIESLKKTWKLAQHIGLDQIEMEDIDKEIKAVRKKRLTKNDFKKCSR